MKMAWLSGRSRWGAASAGLLAALLLSLSGPASAVGIADTKHNLGSGTGPAGRNQTNDTAEICVFCHTPHGGDVSAPVPLWNKRLAVATPTYQTYGSLQTPSLDGTVAAVGSVSLACLSCHDGTQAMDNIINAPGSGGVVDDGGGVNGRAFTWTGSTVAPGPGGNGGTLISGPALIGTDLRNDHPIGIQYCGGGLTGSGTTVSGTCNDTDFKPLSTQNINSNQIFWVETGGGGKQRTDLPLYVRTGADASLGPLVECASCHDPHVSENQPGPALTGQQAGATFLRISNASSAVCTACHVK